MMSRVFEYLWTDILSDETLLFKTGFLERSPAAPRLFKLVGVDERQVETTVQPNSRINIELELELFLAFAEFQNSLMRAQLID